MVAVGGPVEGPLESSAARLLGRGAAALGWTTLAGNQDSNLLSEAVKLYLVYVIA